MLLPPSAFDASNSASTSSSGPAASRKTHAQLPGCSSEVELAPLHHCSGLLRLWPFADQMTDRSVSECVELYATANLSCQAGGMLRSSAFRQQQVDDAHTHTATHPDV